MFKFLVNKVSLEADASGAIFWRDRRVLVVSDLHLEKASFFAEKGTPLPPYDTVETLDRLEILLQIYRPELVISLGDSFHDNRASERIVREHVLRICTLTKKYKWIWITGNHDSKIGSIGGGISMPCFICGPLTFRHQAAVESQNGEISGHFHPRAQIQLRRRRVVGRCFITDSRRLILPAFGAFTGGLDVSHMDIRGLFGNQFDVLFLGPSKVHKFSNSSLVQSRFKKF